MEWIQPEHGKAISKTYTAITSAEGLLKPGNKESKRNALTNSPGDLFHVSKSALVR
ncbi:hypothetical protein [Sphingobacterium siyangense]|jgi:hypothetical protein|uniref:hypothetical protein n=1 Tax=Sphingobacterium siyangense TaxID=459529 RepID=UPI0028AC8776|nr:hypothetical protein [Sphingobacterium siyangense]